MPQFCYICKKLCHTLALQLFTFIFAIEIHICDSLIKDIKAFALIPRPWKLVIFGNGMIGGLLTTRAWAHLLLQGIPVPQGQ